MAEKRKAGRPKGVASKPKEKKEPHASLGRRDRVENAEPEEVGRD